MTPAPATAPPAALLLTPGASASRDQPALVAIDRAVGAAGVVVERMDFPYTRAGRRAPDRPPVLVAAVAEGAAALAAAAGVAPGRVVLGGRSMGGRICSMAAAEGLACLGLVLVSYPLHPPGRPDRLRVDHFPRLRVPCLFVSGTRDAFAAPAELEEHAAAIPGPVSHVWLDGGDHGLRGRDAEVAAAVAAWVTERAREGRPRG
ncbi:MAG: alpha/beta family hydrolase [Acidimicrobiia bacterium]